MVWESKNRLFAPETSDERVIDVEMQSSIIALLKRYPQKQAALLPALHLVQNKLGKISEQAMLELAELLEISPAKVMDTASFYDLFSLKKRGRHVIGVCESLSCELCGGGELLEALKKKLAIEEGETTPDGKISLITMQCLGACDFAPAMLVDGELHKNVTTEKLDDILGRLK